MAQLNLELLATQNLDYASVSYVDLEMSNYVHKHLERFIYSPFVRPDAVPVSYLETESVNSKDNLQIADKTWTVPANSKQHLDLRNNFIISFTKTFNSAFKEILATNKTYINSESREVPLFFKHVLPEDATSCTLEVIKNGNKFDIDDGFYIDLENKSVFTNYQNFYDRNTKNYILFFLSGSTTTGAYRELLNPVSVATEAEWTDIDQTTGAIKDTSIVYTKEPSGSGYLFTFSKADRWYIKPIEESFIQPLAVSGYSLNESWYMRFSNGLFSSYTNGTVRKYAIPEFLDQAFAPYYPVRFSTYSNLEYVNSKILKFPKQNLVIDPANDFNLEVRIFDVNGVLIKVYTTDTSLAGERYSNTEVFYELGIDSWDESKGFVSFNESIDASWKLNAQYFYKSNDYEYTNIDLNPIFNPQVLNSTVVFYLIPGTTHKALHHLLVDTSGRITYTSQSEGDIYPNLQLVDGMNVYNPNTIIGSYYSSELESSFISDYTAGQANNYGYAVLAEVNFKDTAYKDETVFKLTRKGLTLTPLKAQTTLLKNARILQSIFGYGEQGQELPFNLTNVIEIPITVLEDYGGELTKQEAEALVKTHYPAYAAAVIEWVYPVSDFLTFTSNISGTVSFDISYEGPYTYKVYRKANISGAWELLQTINATSAGDLLALTDSLLDPNSVWYYSITITEDSIEYPHSNTYGIKVA